MKLWKFTGKQIRLTNVNGQIFEGPVWDYIYPEDNEPEGVEGIIMDYPVRNDGFKYKNPVQFNAPEIKSIEII